MKEDKTIAKNKAKTTPHPSLTAFFTSAFLMEEIKDVQLSKRDFFLWVGGVFFPFLTGNMSEELCQAEMSVGEASE